jgi:hypothetical protein
MHIHGDNCRGVYDKATNGTQTLVVAPDADNDRNVLIVVRCAQTFANGSGAKPTFKIGETGDTNKFADTTDFSGLEEGDQRVFAGVLTADTDFIVTATAGTGTATGAITVKAVVTRRAL